MSNGPTSVEVAAREFAMAVAPLSRLLIHPETLRTFLEGELGFSVPPELTTVGLDPAAVDAVIRDLDGLAGELARSPADEAALAARWAALAVDVATLSTDVFGLFGFQRGVMVASSDQLGRPA